MANEFEQLTEKVGKLQETHDTLFKAIPVLQSKYSLVRQDLAKVNKEVVQAQEKLDDIKDEIVLRTDAYNTWQREQLVNLKRREEEVGNREANLEMQLATLGEEAVEKEKVIEQAKTVLKADQDKLVQDQKEITEQKRVNGIWAKKLATEKSSLEGERQELVHMGEQAGDRMQDIQQREAKLEEEKKRVTELVRGSELDRKTAKKILGDAKELIASNDAREQALAIQEDLMKKRERKIKVLEIQLNDQASVMR